jgi:hypothetical protein
MVKEEYSSNLSFPETIVLLALNDKGWFGNSEQRIKFGLAGSLLFELEKAGEIEIRDNHIRISGSREKGDRVMDSALEVLRKSKKKLSLKNAIQRIVYKSGLKWRVLLKNLIKKNILRKEEYHLLGIFHQDKYPVVNIELKKQVQEDLYSKIMGEQELSDKELMLLSIMKTCRMIDKNFLLQEHFLKVRLKVREITEFKEPLPENKQKIKEIQEAIRRSILASNVNLHI